MTFLYILISEAIQFEAINTSGLKGKILVDLNEFIEVVIVATCKS